MRLDGGRKGHDIRGAQISRNSELRERFRESSGNGLYRFLFLWSFAGKGNGHTEKVKDNRPSVSSQ